MRDRWIDLQVHAGRAPCRWHGQERVLVLRYYEGLSDPEIAEALGCRPGTVRGYACRALAALRVELTAPPSAAPVVIKEGR
jgi:hypothetical protein